MKTPCAFCANLNVADLVYEDDAAAVALSKRHVENISELTDDELAHFARVYQRTERVLLEVTGAERAVLVKLGIITPHLHVHIYPVSESLDRAAVMDMIEGRVRVQPDPSFLHTLRNALDIGRRSE